MRLIIFLIILSVLFGSRRYRPYGYRSVYMYPHHHHHHHHHHHVHVYGPGPMMRGPMRGPGHHGGPAPGPRGMGRGF